MTIVLLDDTFQNRPYELFHCHVALRGAAAVAILNNIEQETISWLKLTAGTTNIAESEESRRRDREFFDPAEVNKEVNDRLNEMLTEDSVKQKIKKNLFDIDGLLNANIKY